MVILRTRLEWFCLFFGLMFVLLSLAGYSKAKAQTITANPQSGETTIVLNTVSSQPVINTTIIQKAFESISVPLEVVHHTPERALINANSGLDDGTFVRVAGIELEYENLIRVPESVGDFRFHAFSKQNFQISGWESLSAYTVGVVLGAKIVEKNVRDINKVTKVHNPEALFDLLENDRVDVIVFDYAAGNKIIADRNLTDIVVVYPPLEVHLMYLYLHKKQKDLVGKLTHALREIKQDGDFVLDD